MGRLWGTWPGLRSQQGTAGPATVGTLARCLLVRISRLFSCSPVQNCLRSIYCALSTARDTAVSEEEGCLPLKCRGRYGSNCWFFNLFLTPKAFCIGL